MFYTFDIIFQQCILPFDVYHPYLIGQIDMKLPDKHNKLCTICFGLQMKHKANISAYKMTPQRENDLDRLTCGGRLRGFTHPLE